MPTPNEQLDFNEIISGLMAMAPFFIMTKFVLSTPTQTKSLPEYKPVTKPAPVKLSSVPTVPTRVQEQPKSLFKPGLTPRATW